ncbi:hypothetical protein NBG4_300016 [Candidatus Sulfobium mesophilum]|uniref:Uncharacterized protein n=1 Tax=Candidatus Sulfobium mesophilum TaxID=2016548 RepID=A0A2U3QH89_9BACT|nr:hypothetical protein NBG4_300016 [Candidatus Sulfobium mesophilum]
MLFAEFVLKPAAEYGFMFLIKNYTYIGSVSKMNALNQFIFQGTQA